MRTLPDIEISKDELVKYWNSQRDLYGAEGMIFPGSQQGEARKIFYYPLGASPKKLREFNNDMENKKKKLAYLYQKDLDNDIVPTASISYKGFLVGYDMTSPNVFLPNEITIELLKDLKKRLTYFHEQGIVHGDIKLGNVLMNKKGEAVLCDLDNMQVNDCKIDYYNYLLGELVHDNEYVDRNADIYFYNLLLLQQLVYKDKEYDDIIDEILYGHFPDNVFNEDGIDELYKMQKNYAYKNGKYLIDTLVKRKK